MTRKGSTRVAFGDVVRLSKERCPDPEVAGFERYVGLEHLEPGDLKVRRWGSIADGTTFTTVFRPGQVLFGKRRAYQRKVAVADFEGVCSGDIYALEPSNPTLLPELLPFICLTDAFFDHAVSTSAGSLSPRTNWRSLAEFMFDLPQDLEDQRAIARACQSAVELEESLRSLLQASEQISRSSVEDLMAHDSCELTPLTNLISRVEAGKSLLGGTTPPKPGQFGVLKVGAVVPAGLRPEESKVLLDQADFRPELAIREGDLLITRANTSDLVGLCCVAGASYPNLMLSDKTLRLHPRPGVKPEILLHSLQSQLVRRQVRSSATGTGAAMKNLSQAKILALTVRYPRGERVATAISEIIAKTAAIVEGVRRRLASVQRLRRTIVNEVVSGATA